MTPYRELPLYRALDALRFCFPSSTANSKTSGFQRAEAKPVYRVIPTLRYERPDKNTKIVSNFTNFNLKFMFFDIADSLVKTRFGRSRPISRSMQSLCSATLCRQPRHSDVCRQFFVPR